MPKGKSNISHPRTRSRARFAQRARLGGAKRGFANSRRNPRGGLLIGSLRSTNTNHAVRFVLLNQ